MDTIELWWYEVDQGDISPDKVRYRHTADGVDYRFRGVLCTTKAFAKYYRVVWPGDEDAEEVWFVRLERGWVHGKRF